MGGRCVKTNCTCTHTAPCEYGFIYSRYRELKISHVKGKTIEQESWYDGVTFCPTCDPERAHIQSTSTNSEQLQERLRNRSQFKVVENYDNVNESRTRTL